MKNISILLLLFLSSLCFAIEDVDFNESNDLAIIDEYSLKYKNKDDSKKVELLRKNYEQFKPSKMTYNQEPIIPKIIHFIWLNGSMPKNYQYYVETWKKFHPKWQIKIWNEQDIINEDFANMDLYWLAESYASRADIARYEILKRYGGLYADADIECFKSFDELNHKYDFYANLDPMAIRKDYTSDPYVEVSIINALIGTVPDHPILDQTLLNLRKNWNIVEANFEKKYSFDKRDSLRSKNWLAIEQTMQPLTDAVFDYLASEKSKQYKSIILPISYNFPIYFADNSSSKNKLKTMCFMQPDLFTKNVIKPEIMSFHHFKKQNSLMFKPKFLESLYKINFITKRMVTYLTSKNKYFLNFQGIYNGDFPTNIQYEPLAQIPEVIYIDNEKLKNEWQKLNPHFKIKIIDNDYNKNIPKEFLLYKDNIKKLLNIFYLLKNNGGVYVDSNFKPANLAEFNHKYGYYGIIKQPNGIFDDNAALSAAIIASKAKNTIMIQLIKDIEKQKNITIMEIMNLYRENVYKYNQMDGKNIVFPEVIFNQKR